MESKTTFNNQPIRTAIALLGPVTLSSPQTEVPLTMIVHSLRTAVYVYAAGPGLSLLTVIGVVVSRR